ncbi:MAG: hypothetical protein ACJAYU_002177 [Bradymonadia bacterium]|jgi:hypothetical protein
MSGWLLSSAVIATGSGAICAILLNRAYGGVNPEAGQIGWASAMAAIGGHPAVLIAFAALLFGGVAIASIGERLTRLPIVGAAMVLALTVIPFALGISAIEFAEFASFGMIDSVQSELAATNLLDDWWIFGLWFGLTWVAGRHNLSVLPIAVWIVALYLTWQLAEARVEIWRVAVDQVFRSLPAQIRNANNAEPFQIAGFAMYLRSLTDIFLFTTPMLAIGMLRRRKVSTLVIERARDSLQ